jgi:hypothetical protein
MGKRCICTYVTQFYKKHFEPAFVFSNFTDNFCETDEAFLMILKQNSLHGDLGNLRLGREKSVSFVLSGNAFSVKSVPFLEIVLRKKSIT